MGDDTMPFDDSEPTVEAIAKFLAALFDVLARHHRIPLLPLTDPQAEELNNLLDEMLQSRAGEPLHVHDKAGLRQLRQWFQEGMLP